MCFMRVAPLRQVARLGHALIVVDTDLHTILRPSKERADYERT